MFHRNWRPVALLLACFSLPAVVHAQAVEQEEGETIHIAAPSGTWRDRHPDLTQAAEKIIHRTNEFRHEKQRTELPVNSKLTATAQSFADYMARTNRYGHHADGRGPGQRVRKHGYDYCIVAENIAFEFNSAGLTTDDVARTFFEGWKKSPPHRKNMLDADVVETGVAIAHSKETGYYYAVQLFGRPRSRAITFQTSNASNATIEYHVGDRAFSLPPRYSRTHTVCRPTEVTFDLPGERTKTAHPQDGDRFTVTRHDGKVDLEKDRNPDQ